MIPSTFNLPTEFRLERVRELACGGVQPVIATAADAAAYWRGNIANGPGFEAHAEHFYILLLDHGRRLMGHRLVAKGSGNEVIAHVADLILTAICAGAGAVMVAHNHPSNTAIPSAADVDWSQRALLGFDYFGIRFLDHVVIGPNILADENDFSSVREHGGFAKLDVNVDGPRAVPQADAMERLLIGDPPLAIAVHEAAELTGEPFLRFAERQAVRLLRQEFLKETSAC